MTPLRFAEFAEEAGVPRGMIQVATGDGATGAALAEHPGVDHVTFVGSAATGARVAEVCARRLAPLELELGGKSPNVVFADADLDRAVPEIVNALIQNAGQSCSAGTRLLVERTAFDDVTARVAAALEQVTIGPGIEDHAARPADLRPPAAARAAHARGRPRARGGGQRRRAPRRPLSRAGAGHERHARDGALRRGGLRPGADRERVRLRPRRDRARQRDAVRARGRRLDDAT